MEHDDRMATSNRVDGSVLGPSLQAGVIHGGVHYHGVPDGSSRRGQATGEPSGEVTSLLRAQVRAAQELPRLLPGARRPALADVYVRQGLGSGVEDPQPEPPRPTPILDGHGQLVEVPGPPVARVAVRPPIRTVREALDSTDHLVVTGGAGQGKSMLSMRLAADIAVRWLDGGADPLTEPVVPLRLTARELAARLDLPFPEALADSVRADYGAFLRMPVSSDALCEHVAGRRWLLLVDGLDEVADGDDRDRLVKVLASCAGESHYRVVLTTRPIEGAVLAPLHRIGAVRYELQPFDDETLRCFAENWFADEGSGPAERFLRQIRAAHLDEMVRVPLLATIAAIVFQQSGDLPLPDNQYELYEAYFSFLRSIRPADSPFEAHRARLLEHLGLVRVETDTSLVAAARDWVGHHVGADRLSAGWSDRLTAFLVAVGPLVIRGDDLTFLHHSFAEHLAATATASRLPTTFAADHEDFARLLHAARPKERGRYARSVALHYTRLRPDQADPLLRALHAGGAEQHVLAARLLAKRMPATTGVVDAFLETVRGWATTTHHLGGDILAQTCRATQHPGLATWLVGLMRDEHAPWLSRTEAAAALSVRLRGEHLAEAIRFLHAVVDDAEAAVEVRLAAAEALTDSGVAERDAAERGLRSVLDDPAGSGADYRTAAVILAAFGRDARDFAATALTRLLDDRDTAPGIVVEAATGLIEIGMEFHARAVEAFRLVLHDRVHSESARGDAALGLASLGPEHTEEAVAALTAVVGDRRRTRVDRVSAAEVLGRLGPQHRQVAGESVRAMLAEPDIRVTDIRHCAARLAGFGPGFREEAERRLREIITDHGTPVEDVAWALNALGGLGAEHLPEVARRSWDLLGEIGPDTDLYTTVLGHLTDLGEPHRTAAVERLQALLVDGTASARSRCRAASRLIDAGPELHAEAARHLLAIAAAEASPFGTIDAWYELVKLGPQFRDGALDVLLRTAERVDAECVVWFGGAYILASSETDLDRIGEAMTALAADPGRSITERMSGLRGLSRLGPRFHRRAVRQLCALVRSVTTMEFNFRYHLMMITEMGIGLREETARVLLDLTVDQRTGYDRMHRILVALELIGFADNPIAHAALRTVAEYSDRPYVRLEAQCMLLSVDPASAPAIADDVFAPEGDVPIDAWQRTIDQLAHLGVDVAPRLCALLTDPDTDYRVRWGSAMHLARSFPEHRDKGVLELTRQLSDIYQRPSDRSHALRQFVDISPVTRDQAIDAVAALVGDERLSVHDRCECVSSHVSLNRAAAPGAVALLGRLADDSQLAPAERAEAVCSMENLGPEHVKSNSRLVAAAALDSGTGKLRRSLIAELPRDLRTRVERTLLDDHALGVMDRVPKPDFWYDVPLIDEFETSVREILTEPEFSLGERVDAVKRLGWLQIRTVPEAIVYLESVPDGSSAARRAKRALIWLGTARGRETWRETERIALDRTLSLRQRITAARLLLGVASRTPRSLVGVLREVVADPGTSDQRRAEALLALGPFDGLSALRALRDDERTPTHVRWLAADELTDFQPEDRAAAARLFAGDPGERPALRWRAAERLANCGQVGRDRAVELLWAIARDPGLPVGARARAAATLGSVAPSTRNEVLRLLRTLLSTDKPLLRRNVLLAIGEVRPDEAALELLAMARDTRHGSVARVWCAEGAVQLRRECRDGAAVVVREVASDARVARHVRRRAACCLARWSEVCREEARELIRALDRAAAE